MMLIDRFMPVYSLRQVDRVAVAVSPDRAYATARALDMNRVGFVRWLFELRTLPERIAARLRGETTQPSGSARIEDIARAGSGFQILDEDPGREVVVGAIGKVWRPAIEFARVKPGEFAAFVRPGFAKVVWCIRVDPREGGGAWIGFDLRVDATDEESLDRFKRYWWIIGRFSHAIRHEMLRLFVRELGRAPDEDELTLAGDELLPPSGFQKTHAITIEAPPARVWPWLLQMGCRRAGWYSIDFLDNGRVHSAEHIIPELQKLSIGDILPARPKGPEGFAVLRIEPERALVLGSPQLLPEQNPPLTTLWLTTWAFVLEPIGDSATRLIVRARARRQDGAKAVMAAMFFGAAHEIMERTQLVNLKRRAEARSVVHRAPPS